MSKSSGTKPDPIRIGEAADGKRAVILHPENDDLFIQTGKQVIEACRLNISINLWLKELGAMLKDVAGWIDQRTDRIRGCYAAPRGATICLFFIPSTDRFDFDLADELALLYTRLMNHYNIGMVETYQIPWSDWDRFLHPESARTIYGQQLPAHSAVDA